ncbi:hypothetical protein KI387_015967, partial [Taxus chinensis]
RGSDVVVIMHEETHDNLTACDKCRLDHQQGSLLYLASSTCAGTIRTLFGYTLKFVGDTYDTTRSIQLNDAKPSGFIDNLACPKNIFYTTSMSVLSSASRLSKARELLKEMKSSHCRPDYVTCNTLIDKFGDSSNVVAAWEVRKEMEEDGCGPNVVTFHTLIKALYNGSKVDEALGLLDEMVEGGHLLNLYTYNYLIGGLLKNNRPDGV